MLKKIFMALLIALSLLVITPLSARGDESITPYDLLSLSHPYDLSSNYFAHTEIDDDVHSKSIDYFLNNDNFKDQDGNQLRVYLKVAENDNLSLYLSEESLNIAVLVKSTGYVFYTNPKYNQWDIEAYDTTSGVSPVSSTIPVDGIYNTSIDKDNKPILNFTYKNNGFKCSFKYDKLGISYNLYVTLKESGIEVYVPNEEIVEEDYIVKTQTFKKDEKGNRIIDENGKFVMEITETSYSFLLKSLTFFQYLGSSFMEEDDTWLNGYIFIPDGSGALVRYQNRSLYKTAYIKKVYGDDKGLDDTVYQSQASLKEESNLTLPLYGVVHGANRNAFINVISEGDTNATLELRPYGYSNENLETVFYKFYYRQPYNIKVATSATGTISSINAQRYTGDVRYTYSFLTGEDANYNGMASYYKENYLTLTDRVDDNSSLINLKVLAMDYKKGLFGKNFIPLTKYSDLLNIIKELERSSLDSFDIEYIGMYRGGNFSGVIKPRIAYKLGSKKNYNELVNYMDQNNYNLSAYLDPSVTYKTNKRGITKKLNLSTFNLDSYGDLFENSYELVYTSLSKDLMRYEKRFNAYGIDSVTLERIGSNLNSYRFKNVNYYREDNKNTIKDELNNISSKYSVGLYKANSYTYEYLSRYYDMYSESNSYTFISDSVPFISLILSGYSELYSGSINYVDDYLLNALRLIEYNIYPSFMISKEDSSLLRYTNFESKFASEYDRWKPIIVAYYNMVSNTLKCVKGANMVEHIALEDGVSLTKYSNGKGIIVNFKDTNYIYSGHTIKAKGAEVIEL